MSEHVSYEKGMDWAAVLADMQEQLDDLMATVQAQQRTLDAQQRTLDELVNDHRRR